MLNVIVSRKSARKSFYDLIISHFGKRKHIDFLKENFTQNGIYVDDNNKEGVVILS
jgi:predicted CopG family antitoxin